ncbi:hypothetical protein [Microbulbifer epialgicus]|uniref:Uncharacterized protein n=1 Tax=Microbulbifer epialgicus TaxID=393907 RepID=A0ABV4NY39_9GAMM
MEWIVITGNHVAIDARSTMALAGNLDQNLAGENAGIESNKSIPKSLEDYLKFSEADMVPIYQMDNTGL